MSKLRPMAILSRPVRLGVLAAVVVASGLWTFGQQPGGRTNRGMGGGGYRGSGEVNVPEGTKTAREWGTRSEVTPEWTNPLGFEADVLTFARLRYDKTSWFGLGRRSGGGWTTDFPDSDLNLSYRLQQMTATKTDPNARIIRATDPDLGKYPFLYVAAPGSVTLNEPDIVALRKYLTNGGFMLMTDFWGYDEWANCEALFKQILPGSSFVELPIEHELYRSVFKITEKKQVPQSDRGMENQNYPEAEWITHQGGDAGREVHHRVIMDAKGRIMVMALHNTDDADGWEREAESDFYFRNFSEKRAYPLAINILFYVMTH